MVKQKIGDLPGWEDVVQEVYVSCLATLSRVGFEGKSSLKTWLYRIIFRRIVDKLRRVTKQNKNICQFLEGVDFSYKQNFCEKRRTVKREDMLREAISALPERENRLFSFLCCDLTSLEIRKLCGWNKVIYDYYYKRGIVLLKEILV